MPSNKAASFEDLKEKCKIENYKVKRGGPIIKFGDDLMLFPQLSEYSFICALCVCYNPARTKNMQLKLLSGYKFSYYFARHGRKCVHYNQWIENQMTTAKEGKNGS